jgi:lysophospholipase L1-like esterase
VLCLGDSITEFGSHIINGPRCDKLDPVASEFLRLTGTDNPLVEHGPGWTVLLQRDYHWRTTADVVNRGHSGYTSRLLRADLSEILGALGRTPVLAVILCVGLNDCVEQGHAQHVALADYKANIIAVLEEIRRWRPEAKRLVLTPPPIDGKRWNETVKGWTKGTKTGGGRTQDQLLAYAEACQTAAKPLAHGVLDLVYGFQYEMAQRMHELQNPHRDGLHFTNKVNTFVYRKVRDVLSSSPFDIGPSQGPIHRPSALAAAYPSSKFKDKGYSDDDGRVRKR